MRSVLLALTLVACTSTEPSGDIFAPVVPPAAQPAAAPVSDAVPEEFRISSEEMQQNAAEARSEQAPPETPNAEATGPASDAVAPADGAVADAPPAEAAPESAVPPVTGPPVAGSPVAGSPVNVPPAAAGWPVRLLKTLPESQPPRAILGLPDGTEIVVSPGSLIAAQGLVVMSVGRSTLDLARVTPSGDHAVIDQLTLTAQY